MKIAECSHIRIRDGNDYGMNVERMIKHLEARYNIEFRSLPRWETLVQRMHLSITDCKRQIQASKRRKAMIIDKLYQECCRPSPFELTDDLVRTAKKWQNMKAKYFEPRKISIEIPFEVHSSKYEIPGEEILEEASVGHQNTENVASTEALDLKVDTKLSEVAVEVSQLPNFICMNQHKIISPIRSTDESLRRTPSAEIFDIASSIKPAEWQLLNKTSRVRNFPKVITINDNSLEEQVLKFSLLNCTTEYLNLRFMRVTEKEYFRRAKILPKTPLRLYPGLAVTFKFVFRLIQSNEEFTSQLYFRVGQKVLTEAPIEAFCVPIASKFIDHTLVILPDVVTIPSMYYWRINAENGFPTSKMSIAVLGNISYDLHISKLDEDLTKDSEESLNSIDAFGPNTESMLLREEDRQIVTQSRAIVLSTDEFEEVTSIKIEDIAEQFVEEIIEQALDVFVFEKSFLHLEPFSKNSIEIYQTKAEYIGLHQNLYELEFSYPETGETAFCKTLKVYGEALPNPIQVQPYILDMSESPVIHGYCQDHFTVINKHKIFPVTIKIKLTTKIKKLIRITPMETLVIPASTFDFTVRICSKDLQEETTREDLVHLTIKIRVIGDKSIYRGLPPIFYEIIVPCSFEFKKLYNTKFFDEFPEPSVEETEIVMPPLELNLQKSPKTPRTTTASRTAMSRTK